MSFVPRGHIIVIVVARTRILLCSLKTAIKFVSIRIRIVVLACIAIELATCADVAIVVVIVRVIELEFKLQPELE